MADRVSASITIGGTLTQAAYCELAGQIASERLSIEWDGAPFEPDDRSEGQPLRLYAHEVAGGTFEDLEAWCVAQGVPFTRWCAGYGAEWGPERVVFTGSGDARSFVADENDRVLIDQADVTRLGSIEALCAHFAAADFVIPPLEIVAAAPPKATDAVPGAGACQPSDKGGRTHDESK